MITQFGPSNLVHILAFTSLHAAGHTWVRGTAAAACRDSTRSPSANTVVSRAVTADWYDDPRWLRAPKQLVSAAAVIADDGGRVLLVRTPQRGWELPGGQVERGESAVHAAAREIREESGIEAEITRFCGVVQNAGWSMCDLLFLGRPLGGTPRPMPPETTEAGFFKMPHVLDLLTFGTFRLRLERCLDRSSQPFFVQVARKRRGDYRQRVADGSVGGGMMERLQLGRGGPEVSRLAYGCAALAGPWEAGELTPERRRQALDALEAALGGRHRSLRPGRRLRLRQGGAGLPAPRSILPKRSTHYAIQVDVVNLLGLQEEHGTSRLIGRYGRVDHRTKGMLRPAIPELAPASRCWSSACTR